MCRVFSIATICLISATGIVALERLHPTTLQEHGTVDWIGHLLTALILAVGLRSPRLPIPIWAVLIGGLVPDIGHILAFLDLAEKIPGSSRNGSHSLVVVALITLIGLADRQRANVWLGIAIGALTHLWRDMGTGTVPLLWPFLDVVWGVSFWVYVTGTVVVGFALILSRMRLDDFTCVDQVMDEPTDRGSLYH